MASPIALEPEAQAVTAGIADPRQSCRIAIMLVAMLLIIIGMNNGETRRGIEEEGDVVLEQEDSHNYKRAILRDGKLDSILLQGSIDYSGIYQYLIKHKIDLSGMEKDVFHLSFADFYGVKENGGYCYQDQA